VHTDGDENMEIDEAYMEDYEKHAKRMGRLYKWWWENIKMGKMMDEI
jgi:hypothetical protein